MDVKKAIAAVLISGFVAISGSGFADAKVKPVKAQTKVTAAAKRKAVFCTKTAPKHLQTLAAHKSRAAAKVAASQTALDEANASGDPVLIAEAEKALANAQAAEARIDARIQAINTYCAP